MHLHSLLLHLLNAHIRELKFAPLSVIRAVYPHNRPDAHALCTAHARLQFVIVRAFQVEHSSFTLSYTFTTSLQSDQSASSYTTVVDKRQGRHQRRKEIERAFRRSGGSSDCRAATLKFAETAQEWEARLQRMKSDVESASGLAAETPRGQTATDEHTAEGSPGP